MCAKPDDHEISLLDRILRELAEIACKSHDRSLQTTLIIVDLKKRPKRWMVERSFGWLDEYRKTSSKLVSNVIS